MNHKWYIIGNFFSLRKINGNGEVITANITVSQKYNLAYARVYKIVILKSQPNIDFNITFSVHYFMAQLLSIKYSLILKYIYIT